MAIDEFSPLTSVLVQTPALAFRDAETVGRQWQALGYTEPPDPESAGHEHEAFVARLRERGVDVLPLQEGDAAALGLDSLYTRDASVVGPDGAVLCRMGKVSRRDEAAAHDAALRRLGVPIAGRIVAPGMLEGGDVVWFDERTVAVGCGYRTNEAGIRQLEALQPTVRECITVALPHWNGPDDVFHLMSILSPLDRDLALVFSPLLSVVFRRWLIGRGVELVEVAEDEFEALGCNVLAIAPRVCLMAAGSPETRRRLERRGVEVVEISGAEICTKGMGGPTCLTRPLARA